MGRNLWLNQADFSRIFTVLVWDDLLCVLPPRPEPPESSTLKTWVEQILESDSTLPVIYRIWRQRPNGGSETDAAYAYHEGTPVMIDAAYDEVVVVPIEQFPELDYAPPSWRGVEGFSEAFAGTPLTLEAAPLAAFFREELKRLRDALDSDEFEWGII